MKKIRFYPFNEETKAFSMEPEPAYKFLPEWYKKTPSVIETGGLAFGQIGSTVKKCMPIFDLMTAGYMITAPCDIYLDATNPERLSWSIPAGLLSHQGDMFATHDKQQYEHMPFDKDLYHKDLLRVFPFFAVGTPKGYSTIFLNPPYTDSSPLTALQAIVDTDAFITDGHLSFWVKKDFKGVIKKGTPLIQAIPIKRDSWQKEIASVEKSEAIFTKQRLSVRSVFTNGYKLFYRARKTFK